MAQAIQYNGDNADQIKELFNHLEVEELGSVRVNFRTLYTKIGHIYKNDWAVIDENGKYAIYKPEEYASFRAAGLFKDEQ